MKSFIVYMVLAGSTLVMKEEGNIGHLHNRNYLLPELTAGQEYKLTVDRTLNTDFDCYLLTPNQHGQGWVISDKETNRISCVFVFTAQQPKYKIWFVNNGGDTHYTVSLVK